MMDVALKRKIVGLFLRVRQRGFVLGLSELLAAARALDGESEADQDEELKRAAHLLWCKSVEEAREFNNIWEQYMTETASTPPEERSANASEPSPQHPLIEGAEAAARERTSQRSRTPRRQPGRELTGLAIYPPFVPAFIEDREELNTYWPLSRRSMIYGWRYLRQPIPDGPAELLDIEGTVNEVARLGFFLSPVYRRRDVNHAHLLLFIDQDGSMVPFHRFTRDIVETVLHESDIEKKDIIYFNNVPTPHVFLDPFLTNPIALEEVLAQCSSSTSVLIVSDAGAARGFRRIERIRMTTIFLTMLKERTALVGWLNPMPKERWLNTSAYLISHLVSMFQMSPEGFNSAIDVVRGQPLRHYI
jgi:hypothetical protein